MEDETGLQELFKKVLTMEGYAVQVAGDGDIGYQEYRRFEPELVVADVVLPICSGIELVRKIREENFRIKVVYMSGFFGIEGLKKDLDAEIHQYGYPTLAKPFKISALLSTVQESLDGCQHRPVPPGVCEPPAVQRISAPACRRTPEGCGRQRPRTGGCGSPSRWWCRPC